jgi:hypothetical protein
MYLCPYFYAIKFDWQLVNYVRTDMGWPSFTSLSFYYEPLVFIGSQFSSRGKPTVSGGHSRRFLLCNFLPWTVLCILWIDWRSLLSALSFLESQILQGVIMSLGQGLRGRMVDLSAAA